jgi:hypothetical protein
MNLEHSISTIVVDRRDFIKGAAMASGTILLAESTLATTGCGKEVLVFTSTLRAALVGAKPLLPKLGDRIAQAIAATEAFESAYRAGKFVDAVAVFKNLAPTVEEILQNADIGNSDVKRYIALIGVALSTIASLLESQRGEPQVAAIVAANADVPTETMVRRRALALDSIVATVRQ